MFNHGAWDALGDTAASVNKGSLAAPHLHPLVASVRYGRQTQGCSKPLADVTVAKGTPNPLVGVTVAKGAALPCMAVTKGTALPCMTVAKGTSLPCMTVANAPLGTRNRSRHRVPGSEA